jgi:uncharacterized protein (TIGR02217 family)
METSTIVKRSASGRRIAISMFATPIYHFEFKYAGLSSAAKDVPLGKQSMQALQALYGTSGGQYGTFRLKKSHYTKDTADSLAVTQPLGIGDGANKTFIFMRTIQTDYVAAFTEPVGIVEPLGLNVYVNGTLKTLTTDYSIVWPNVLQFVAAPAAGSIITADFSWYFMCAFEEDTLELAIQGKQWWTADSVKISTVKL